MKLFIFFVFITFVNFGVICSLDVDANNATDSKCKTVRIQRGSDAISNARGYSQIVVVDDCKSGIRNIHLAGQTFLADGTLEGQIRAVWAGIDILLGMAGATFADLVSVTNAITDINDTRIDLFIAIRREILSGGNPVGFVFPEVSMSLGTKLARTFLQVEIKVELAVLPTPKDWKLKPFPLDKTLEDMVYEKLNITPIEFSEA